MAKMELGHVKLVFMCYKLGSDMWERKHPGLMDATVDDRNKYVADSRFP